MLTMRSSVLVMVATIGALVALVAAGCSDPTRDALTLEKNGDWEGALVVYRAVLAEDPDDLEALSGMATALWLLGRYDEALPFQERVVGADPQDIQTRVELAFNYLNHQGRPTDAAKVLDEAVALERSARILTFRGQAEKQAGELERAESSFREAIAVDASHGYAYYQLATLLEEEGRDEEAALVRQDAENKGVELIEVE